jgi:hypothetical protein
MGWSFYGEAALSLVYGTQKVHGYNKGFGTGGNVVSKMQNVHDSWSMLRPMTNLAFGLRWDHLFSNDNYRIRLQLGYEQANVVGFDKDINFVDSQVQGKFTYSQGDVGISGIAFQGRLDF